MKFKSVNEIDKFGYRDSYIEDMIFEDKCIVLMAEALIVKANNSNNSNYTDSYAGTSRISFSNGSVEKITKLGYKRFDANDNLLDSIDDKEVLLENKGIIKICKGAYLTSIEQGDEKLVSVGIEIPDEDPTAITDEYEIVLKCDEVIIEWDKYLNRVEK